jgi:putative tricarboxylic transport membrane protein
MLACDTKNKKRRGGTNVPPSLRRGWLIATAAMFVLCLFAIWQSLLLSLTDRLGPGPGFFPFWLGIIGALFAVLLALDVIRQPASDAPDEPLLPRGEGAWRVLAVVGALAAATLLMDIIGFEWTMLAFNAGLVVALGERRWPVIAVFAAAGSFGVYYVFTTWLDVLLPTAQWATG